MLRGMPRAVHPGAGPVRQNRLSTFRRSRQNTDMRITATVLAIARVLRASALIALTALPGLAGDWSPKLAAQYLDSRQKEWFAWPAAKRSGGPCISCHTGVTYMLARPALRRVLGEAEPTAYETGLVEGLRARVGSGLE